eukprot:tig00021348_g20583.t1
MQHIAQHLPPQAVEEKKSFAEKPVASRKQSPNGVSRCLSAIAGSTAAALGIATAGAAIFYTHPEDVAPTLDALSRSFLPAFASVGTAMLFGAGAGLVLEHDAGAGVHESEDGDVQSEVFVVTPKKSAHK